MGKDFNKAVELVADVATAAVVPGGLALLIAEKIAEAAEAPKPNPDPDKKEVKADKAPDTVNTAQSDPQTAKVSAAISDAGKGGGTNNDAKRFSDINLADVLRAIKEKVETVFVAVVTGVERVAEAVVTGGRELCVALAKGIEEQDKLEASARILVDKDAPVVTAEAEVNPNPIANEEAKAIVEEAKADSSAVTIASSVSLNVTSRETERVRIVREGGGVGAVKVLPFDNRPVVADLNSSDNAGSLRNDQNGTNDGSSSTVSAEGVSTAGLANGLNSTVKSANHVDSDVVVASADVVTVQEGNVGHVSVSETVATNGVPVFGRVVLSTSAPIVVSNNSNVSALGALLMAFAGGSQTLEAGQVFVAPIGARDFDVLGSRSVSTSGDVATAEAVTAPTDTESGSNGGNQKDGRQNNPQQQFLS